MFPVKDCALYDYIIICIRYLLDTKKRVLDVALFRRPQCDGPSLGCHQKCGFGPKAQRQSEGLTIYVY